MLNAQLMPVFSLLGTMFRISFGILGAILKPLFAVFKAFSAAMMQPITRVAEAVRPIGEKFEELAPRIIKTLQPVISIISFIGNLIGNIVGFVIGGLVDGFIFAFDTIFGIFDSFYGFIQDYILSPIQSMLDLVQKGIDALASLNPFGGDDDLASDSSKLQSGGSIDDGIVQDGKIISTHPEDTLIATKTPDSLFGESMFGKIMSATPLGMIANSVNSSTDGGISNVAGGIGDAMSGVGDMIGGLFGGDTKDADIVAKLDELLIVMSGNKDVYMDGKKLTAGVSNQSDKFAGNSNALV
jgi:phage-related protein